MRKTVESDNDKHVLLVITRSDGWKLGNGFTVKFDVYGQALGLTTSWNLRRNEASFKANMLNFEPNLQDFKPKSLKFEPNYDLK